MLGHKQALRVLLVDDDSIFRNFVRQAMEGLGPMAVQEASDGRQACQLMQQTGADFDLVVCDVFMPDMDGMEFLEFLVKQRYQGKLTMVSGGDATILEMARLIAVNNKLQLVGAFPKEAITPQLLGAILDFE